MENLDDIVCSLSECLKINKKNQGREREKKKKFLRQCQLRINQSMVLKSLTGGQATYILVL